MELQLIKGTFTARDAFDLIEQMVQVKIRFHEQKIVKSESEEDIKMREKRIKELQDALKRLRMEILSGHNSHSVEARIVVS